MTTQYAKRQKNLKEREQRYLEICDPIASIDIIRKHINLRTYCAPEIISYLMRRGWRVETNEKGTALGNKDGSYYEKEEEMPYNTNSYRDFII